MFNKCKEMEQQYTANNNVTRHLNPPYLVSNVAELNILANSTENRLGLMYTIKLINCHRHRNGFDAVCILQSLCFHCVLSNSLLDEGGTDEEERNMGFSFSTPREIARGMKRLWE